MADEPEKPAEPAAALDVGPDPVWGVCVAVVGLFTMAIAGAITNHWWFNIGEALLLLGAAVFLVSLALTSVKQQPIGLAERVREWFRGRQE